MALKKYEPNMSKQRLDRNRLSKVCTVPELAEANSGIGAAGALMYVALARRAGAAAQTATCCCVFSGPGYG